MPNRPFPRRRFAGIRFVVGLGLLCAAARASGLEPLCVPDDRTLCLNDGRFSVTASFQQTPSGPSTFAHAVGLTGDSGYFWFFDETNVELVVKVLDGCSVFNTFWFFAAGLTNVGVAISVEDLRTRTSRLYENPIGTPFAPIQDTNAFATCP